VRWRGVCVLSWGWIPNPPCLPWRAIPRPGGGLANVTWVLGGDSDLPALGVLLT
jgi:hypothetical protein